ncbi:hypothetical protein JL721_13137 [Aureococcus anophagefferens]|nr:hypothetical protein JL721_13137 [Aureococcus anophagefferens]
MQAKAGLVGQLDAATSDHAAETSRQREQVAHLEATLRDRDAASDDAAAAPAEVGAELKVRDAAPAARTASGLVAKLRVGGRRADARVAELEGDLARARTRSQASPRAAPAPATRATPRAPARGPGSSVASLAAGRGAAAAPRSGPGPPPRAARAGAAAGRRRAALDVSTIHSKIRSIRVADRKSALADMLHATELLHHAAARNQEARQLDVQLA